MPDYTAGDAKLRIIPDASEFKSKLEAELKKIDAHLEIGVSAGTAQARTDIERFRDLERRKGIQIGVETSLAQASADMRAWRERQLRDGLVVKAEVNDAEARGKLTELRARERAQNIKIKVDADTGGVLKQIEQLDGAFEGILKSVGGGLKFGLTFTGIGELPAATLAVTQMVGAVQQLAQAGLAVPGIVAGIGASFGTLAIGLDGVKDAYEAVAKASDPSGSEQVQHAREVTQATNSYRNAVVDEAQAERDRTRAIKDAKFALEDLNIQLRGGKISEQQAVNNALRQRRDLQKDMMTGQIKDGLDLQQRLLDIQEADQGVVESRQRNIELQDKVSDANGKGIAQSDQVVAANERVTRSQQQVASSADALKDTVGKSWDAANDALGKLSPNAKAFVQTLAGMKDQFKGFKDLVQDNVFAGLSGSIKTLVDADLPTLKAGMGGIATAWNGTLKELFNSLGSDSSKGLLDRILGDTSKAQTEFNKAIDPLVHGIGVLTAAGADALPRLADDIGAVADRFNAFIAGADQDGRLSKWINDGITGFERIGNTLINVGSAFSGIAKAAGGGDGFLTMLEKGSKAFSDFVNSTEGQNKLKKWFDEGRDEIENHIIPLLKDLPGLFMGIVNVGTQIANTVVPPLKDVATYLSKHKALVKDVVDLFIVWKGITFATGILDQITKISNALGTSGSKSGGKGGKGGKLRGGAGLLGKMALLTGGAMLLDDALTPDSDPSDGDPNNPTKKDSTSGANAIKSDAEAGAATGSALGPWGTAGGFALGTAKGVYDQLQPGSASQKAGEAAHKDDAQIPALLSTLPKKSDGTPFLDPRNTADQLTMSSMADGGDLGMKWVLDGNTDFIRTKRLAWLNAHQDQDGPGFKAPDSYDVPLPPGAPPGMTGGGGSFDVGGPTPMVPGPLPGGGYHAVVHPEEFVQQKSAVATYGLPFMRALNAGAIDPKMLPHFDGGGYIDQNGNPITPGMSPGPSDPSVYAPVAPNPTGGSGLMGALGSFVSGIGGPLQKISGMIPGAGGATGAGTPDASATGGVGAMLPGLWGLPAAMKGGDAGMQLWGQQSGNYLANWAGGTLAKLGGSLYKGALDFFGLGSSILSPDNSWFQAGAQSLGFADKLAPLFGWGTGDGSLQIGSQTTGVGPNGETIQTPTFGTSGTPGSSGNATDAVQASKTAPSSGAAASVQYAQSHALGQKYQYGGVGNTGGYDCSGIASAIYAAAKGKPQGQRYFTTESDFPSLGFVPGYQSGALNVGIHRGGGGPNSHMALTLPNGVNVESGGASDSTQYGGSAAGALNSEFEIHYYLPLPSAMAGPSAAPHFASGALISGPGTGTSDSIMARVSTGEFVSRAASVAKYSPGFYHALNTGAIDPKTLPGFADGDFISSAYVPPQPNPVIPDVQLERPRASAVIPNAPTKQLPQPVGAPAPSVAPVAAAAPANPAQGPNQKPLVAAPSIGAAPTSLNHNLDALNTGIKSGAALAGNLASSAISAAGGIAGGGMGAGAVGSFVNGLIQEGGKIATNVANIGSSLLVGNVPGSGSSTDRASGYTLHAPQNIPDTAPSQVQHNTFNGMDTARVFQELDIRSAQQSQAQLAKYGG
jgi:hypothetical protein